MVPLGAEHPARLDLLARTNIPPSEYEARYVRRLLADEEARLAQLSAGAVRIHLVLCNMPPLLRKSWKRASILARAVTKSTRDGYALGIASTRAVLDDLERRIDVVTRRVDTLRCILAPIRRLPADVVECIFLQCVRPEGAAPAGRARSSPVALCRLCVAWSRIALALPRLWAHLTVPAARFAEPRRFEAVAMRWLARTAAVPLSARIVLPSALAQLGHFFRICGNRCTSLELAVNRASVVVFPTVNAGPPLALEALTFSNLARSRAEYDWGRMITPLMVAPRLRRVTFTSFPAIAPLEIPLPWSQLTHLYVDSISTQDCSWLLAQCRDLVSCTMHVTSFHDPISNTPPSVTTLPRLCHLKLVMKTTEMLKYLFQALILPALESLELLCDSDDTQEDCPYAYFMNLICLSEDKLTHLTMHNIPVPDLRTLLKHLPYLTSLDLYFAHNHIPCHARMIALGLPGSGDGEVFAPRLEWLRVVSECSEPCSVSKTEILDAVVSRWIYGTTKADRPLRVARLRKCYFDCSCAYYDRQWDATVNSRLEIYRHRGLDIDLL